MIKTSKHNISNITNNIKLSKFDSLFNDYKNDLSVYINYIIDGILPLKKRMSSKLLPNEIIKHSKYKRDIYHKASGIIRSQIKRANKKRYNKYKYIYSYMIKNHPQSKFSQTKFSDLKLNNIIYTKYFTTPNIKDISINLGDEFIDIKNVSSFDNFISIRLPYFNEKGTRALKINIPLKYHRHSNKLKNEGYKLKNNIQLKKVNGNYYINLIWEKDILLFNNNDKVLGIDMGYKKLITTSDGDFIGSDMFNLYKEISKKQQGSKKFKKLLTHRDNMINFYINNMNLSNIKKLIIEDLKYVKHKSKIHNKVMNKMQRWSYKKTIDKLERICMEKGILLVKVSPAYTSQTCSSCGNVDKQSRNGECFKCTSCEYENDADINAAINIRNLGICSS